MSWFVVVWSGLVWSSMVGSDLVWSSKVWCGMVWYQGFSMWGGPATPLSISVLPISFHSPPPNIQSWGCCAKQAKPIAEQSFSRARGCCPTANRISRPEVTLACERNHSKYRASECQGAKHSCFSEDDHLFIQRSVHFAVMTLFWLNKLPPLLVCDPIPKAGLSTYTPVTVS